MMTARAVHVRRLADGEPEDPVLASLLGAVGGLRGRVGPGDVVLIKPNFVAPFRHATTDLRVIDYFVTAIREAGAQPVLGESSGFEFDTEATFKVLGVDAFAKQRGLSLLDLEKEPFREVVVGGGLPPVPIAAAAFQSKLIINLPILKGHTITRLTGAVKNLFGLVRKESRRYLHSHGLEQGIAAVARAVPHTLHFVDARRQMQRAVFSSARPLGYALAGSDPFALDHFGARLLGVDPQAVGHLEGVGQYEVLGDAIGQLPSPSRQESARQRVHRACYSAAYWIDHVKHRFFGGPSIIYDLHWYLGIHPVLRPLTAEQAAAVAASCPVGAIDAEKRSIRRAECRAVRCLECYRAHPTLVTLGGLNRPRTGRIA